MRRKFQGVLALVVSLVLLAGLGAIPARAAGLLPRISLLATASDAHATHKAKKPIRVSLPLLVSARDDDFEIRISRPDYDTPFTRVQWVNDGVEVRALPDSLFAPWDGSWNEGGLQRFFHLEVSDEHGAVVAEMNQTFCPYDDWGWQRVDDTGPTTAQLPAMWGCWEHPFGLGFVYGIDRGWASRTPTFMLPSTLKDGRYSVRVTIGDEYLALMGIDPADAIATFDVDVRTRSGRPAEDAASHPTAVSAPADRRPLPRVPDMPNPDPAWTPDLRPLPAWSVDVWDRGDRDYLSFSATIWDAGPVPMTVEGFRDLSDNTMDAYQYFYDNGQVVGRVQNGNLKYDEKPEHDHWHFMQFARYTLVDPSMTEVLRDRKQGFCLVPTDGIDFLAGGVDWQTQQESLDGSVCGGSEDVWVRETLPVGFGDTYGQGFEITDIPNGHYFIRIEADPAGRLIENDDTNNVTLREVIIRGRPGSRKVIVPPYHGIDA